MSGPTREIFGWISAIISFSAYVPYVVEFVGGRTKTHPLTRWMWTRLGLKGGTTPRQASWLIWAALQYVIFVSSRDQGASASVWIALGYFAGSSTVAIMLFWYGEKKWDWLNISCCLLACASLALLYVGQNPFWALVLAILTDGIGSIPTVLNVTQNPTGESRTGWTIFLIGALVNILAVKELNFYEAGYTIYLIAIIGYVTANVWRPRHAPNPVQSAERS